MKPRTLATLAIVTAAAAALAGYALSRQSARVAAPEPEGPAFPGLEARVNDVAGIRVARGKDAFTVRRTEAGWGIADRAGYPAKFEKVKETIVALAELRLVEPRTSSPESYEKIGVEDPGREGSTATLVELSDASGATLAAIILGKPKTSVGFSNDSALYVRRAGEAQSWLARPGRGTARIDVVVDPMYWVERNVIGVARDRVRSVEVTHTPGGETVFIHRDSRETSSFTLDGLPEGRELRFPSSPDTIGSALAYVTLDDVKPADQVDFDAAPASATAVFRTFDGLVVTVRSAKIDEKTWARFEAAYVAPAAPEDASETVQKEAADLAARLGPWAFHVPDYQARNLAPRREDLLKPLPGEVPTNLPEGLQPLQIPGLTAPPPGPIGPSGPVPEAPQPADPTPPPS